MNASVRSAFLFLVAIGGMSLGPSLQGESAEESDVVAKAALLKVCKTVNAMRELLKHSHITGTYRFELGTDRAAFLQREEEILRAIGRPLKSVQNLKSPLFNYSFDLKTYGRKYEIGLTDHQEKNARNGDARSLTGFDGFLYYTVDLDANSGYFVPRIVTIPFTHPACVIEGQAGESMPDHYDRRNARTLELVANWLGKEKLPAGHQHWVRSFVVDGVRSYEFLMKMGDGAANYGIYAVRVSLDGMSRPREILTGYKSEPENAALSIPMRKVTFEYATGVPEASAADVQIPTVLRMTKYANLTTATSIDELKAEYPSPKVKPALSYVLEEHIYSLGKAEPLRGDFPVGIPVGTSISDTITNERFVTGSASEIENQLRK